MTEMQIVKKKKHVMIALTMVALFGLIFRVGTLNNYENAKYYSKHLRSQQLVVFADLPEEDRFHDSINELFSLKGEQIPSYLTNFKSDDRINQLILDSEALRIYKERPHFDPRITLSILIRYLISNPSEGNEDVQIPYFNWNDYVDLSQNDKRVNSWKCSQFEIDESFTVKKEGYYKSPEEYCIDNDDIANLIENEKYKKFLPNFKLIQQSKSASSVHITNSPGRQKMEYRAQFGKLYLNEFMPIPFAITLIHDEFVRTVPIKQDGELDSIKKRLVNTELFTSSVNVQDDLVEFVNSTNPMKPVSSLRFSKDLDFSQFIDPSAELLAHFRPQSHQDQNYIDSLRYSNSNPKDSYKYFDEAHIFSVEEQKLKFDGSHYDWRFFNSFLLEDFKAASLHSLMSAWLAFTRRVELTSWIAHGSLLSWYWNGMAFPWDADFDVQMPITELHRLAREFNQTLIIDLGRNNTSPNVEENEEIRYGRYFIDVSSSITHRTKENGDNVIDARFIDIDTGLYIDITALAVSNSPTPQRYYKQLFKPKNDDYEIVNKVLKVANCRNGHFLKFDDLNPLRLTTFEGQFGYVPNNFGTVLEDEYRQPALVNAHHADFSFSFYLRTWIFDPLNKNKQLKPGWLRSKDGRIIEQDMIKQNSKQLVNYVQAQDFLKIHQFQMQNLDKSQSSEVENSLNSIVPRYLKHDYYNLKFKRNRYNFLQKLKKNSI
ncbi:LicD family-domain-containing protein [Scheffersomyces amazonensis]|uniref:LicD family-domain-containing protein n=1 Tax=Scheffersomyces amazonensis TaxID=1078765 RepID=UPI00315D09D4